MTKKRDTFDFWYAVNNTEVTVMPRQHLETFGSTNLNYHLISELMDNPGEVRIREGRMQASQPQIITPQAYTETLLEGFGEEAAKYVEWLRQHEKEVRVLQYGYLLRQETYSEHVIHDNLKAVAARVEQQVKEKADPWTAVVLGVDDPWDVCLVKLFWEVVQESARTNIRQLQERHLFERAAEMKDAVHTEIEQAFLAASRNPALIQALGQKLEAYGLFDEYQDRFFALVKAGKRKP